MEKKKEEAALQEAYKELGRLYYEQGRSDAEGALADLCMEISNTLINLEEISEEIEAVKSAAGAEVDVDEFDEDDFAVKEDEEEEGFLEQMEDALEDALEGLEEAIEGVLGKLDAEDEDAEVEVEVTEYLDDDDFVAPTPDEVLVEVFELPDEE